LRQFGSRARKAKLYQRDTWIAGGGATYISLAPRASRIIQPASLALQAATRGNREPPLEIILDRVHPLRLSKPPESAEII
jgi:hypothetical protein